MSGRLNAVLARVCVCVCVFVKMRHFCHSVDGLAKLDSAGFPAPRLQEKTNANHQHHPFSLGVYGTVSFHRDRMLLNSPLNNAVVMM